MKRVTKVILGVLLAAVGFIFIGLASYILVFENDEPQTLDGENKNAAVAVIHNIKYNKGNALDISSLSSMCLDYGKGCNVVLPSIIAPEGYEVVGWAEELDAKDKFYKPESEILVDEQMTLYAIVKEKIKEEIGIHVDNVCNKDLICNIGNVVVDTACSQVGYIEKASDTSINDCTADPGFDNYQKFGNSGFLWDGAFINWVFNSSEISLKNKGIEDANDINSYVKWAKNNNKWYTSKSALNNGDLVLTNNNQHIGIAVNIDNDWYMISGNYNNKVALVAIEDISGFINMKGLVY